MLVTIVVACGWVAAARADELTLARAFELARRQAPEVLLAADQVEVARGARTQAGLISTNPELQGAWSDDRLFDREGERTFSLELSQEIQIARQRGLRASASGAALKAAGLGAEAITRAYLVRVGEAFVRVIWAESRAVTAGQILGLNDELLAASSRRLAAGHSAEVDHNLIEAETGRARADLASTRAEAVAARADLNRLLGLPARSSTIALGALPAVPFIADPREESVRRLDIEAARAEVEASAAEVSLAGREGVPSPRVSLSFDANVSVVRPHDFDGDRSLAEAIGTSRDQDRLLGLRIGVPLPIFNRNQGATASATARRSAADHRRHALELSADAELATAGAELDAAAERLRILAALAPKADRSLDLLRRAYDAGQIDAAAFLAARDRAFRVRLEHLAARRDYAVARLRLVAARGDDPAQARGLLVLETRGQP